MKLLKYQKNALLVALYALAKDGPVNSRLGICFNLDRSVVQGRKHVNAYHVVAELAVSWPGNEGEVSEEEGTLQSWWPIANEYDPVTHARLPKWEGNQLAKRLSLIQHLIDSLERPA